MIEEFLKKTAEKRLKIAVVGDAMMDIYHYGHVARVSPEFPVPILRSEDSDPQTFPGGAANVCYQLKNFNTDTYLVSFLDKDSQFLGELNFSCYGSLLSQGRIPRKIRFYDNDFPMLRWDIEPELYGEADLSHYRNELFDNFTKVLDKGIDIAILSNYAKGLFDPALAQRLIQVCRSKNVMTIVDPKANPSMWKGCTVFKPNASEAFKITGLKSPTAQLDYLQKEVDCQTVIITQAGNGVVGKHCDEQFEYKTHETTKEVNVNSVIGAGDCFVAMLALALSHKMSPLDSVSLAFESGVQYVKAKHNQPIYPHELHKRFEHNKSKILSVDELAKLLQTCYSDKKISFTNGVFDIVHSGHLSTLEFAKSKGDRLIVALNTDESVRRLKGETRPIISLRERQELVASLGCVDFVVAFDEDTPLETIKKLSPHAVIKGADYSTETVCGFGVVPEIYLAELKPGLSTTNIIQKIKSI